MTQNALKLDPIFRQFIGFDSLHRQMMQSASQKYPPYDIEHYSVDDDHHIEIAVAVAGFKRDELKVELHDRRLMISGEKEKSEDDSSRNFAHRGISKRPFQHIFHLHEYLQIENIFLDSGLLTITLKQEIPEEKKPKLLEIN